MRTSRLIALLCLFIAPISGQAWDEQLVLEYIMANNILQEQKEDLRRRSGRGYLRSACTAGQRLSGYGQVADV